MLILIQTLFFFLCALLSGFLLVEGWISQGVWAKDCSKGLFASITDMESWAVKKYRKSEPDSYWTFMGIYAAIFIFFVIMIIL